MTGLLSSGNGYLERYKINVLYGLNKYFDFIGVWYKEVADKEEVSCDRISRIIRQDKET